MYFEQRTGAVPARLLDGIQHLIRREIDQLQPS
jgi:hypothetical protein